MCRFSDAGIDECATRSCGRRRKNAKVRNRGKWAAPQSARNSANATKGLRVGPNPGSATNDSCDWLNVPFHDGPHSRISLTFGARRAVVRPCEIELLRRGALNRGTRSDHGGRCWGWRRAVARRSRGQGRPPRIRRALGRATQTGMGVYPEARRARSPWRQHVGGATPTLPIDGHQLEMCRTEASLMRSDELRIEIIIDTQNQPRDEPALDPKFSLQRLIFKAVPTLERP